MRAQDSLPALCSRCPRPWGRGARGSGPLCSRCKPKREPDLPPHRALFFLRVHSSVPAAEQRGCGELFSLFCPWENSLLRAPLGQQGTSCPFAVMQEQGVALPCLQPEKSQSKPGTPTRAPGSRFLARSLAGITPGLRGDVVGWGRAPAGAGEGAEGNREGAGSLTPTSNGSRSCPCHC